MSFGFGEILLLVLVVMIVFGAGKLPAVMGDLAKGVKNFKKGLNEEDEAKPAEKQKAD
jgi:sec-independent protein translocase protein TatA